MLQSTVWYRDRDRETDGNNEREREREREKKDLKYQLKVKKRKLPDLYMHCMHTSRLESLIHQVAGLQKKTEVDQKQQKKLPYKDMTEGSLWQRDHDWMTGSVETMPISKYGDIHIKTNKNINFLWQLNYIQGFRRKSQNSIFAKISRKFRENQLFKYQCKVSASSQGRDTSTL